MGFIEIYYSLVWFCDIMLFWTYTLWGSLTIIVIMNGDLYIHYFSMSFYLQAFIYFIMYYYNSMGLLSDIFLPSLYSHLYFSFCSFVLTTSYFNHRLKITKYYYSLIIIGACITVFGIYTNNRGSMMNIISGFLVGSISSAIYVIFYYAYVKDKLDDICSEKTNHRQPKTESISLFYMNLFLESFFIDNIKNDENT